MTRFARKEVAGPGAIDAGEIAFDIDGVVADTMAVFVRLAGERYGLSELRKEHLTCYDLYRCVPAEREIVDELVCLTLDDEHTLQVPAMPGAPEVLGKLALCGPLRFVTARVWPESIVRWLRLNLPQAPPERIQVTATGDPRRKLEVLRDLRIRYFVEDRLETCHLLSRDGIRPLLFDQPWNRGEEHPYPRIGSWAHLARWLAPCQAFGENSSETA